MFAGLLTPGPCASESEGEDARRLMPFLCRDAVVRESEEKVPLAGEDVEPGTWIVTGEAAPGPRQEFDHRQIDRATGVLADYLEKITGVTCRVFHTPEQASRARVALLVRGFGDQASRAPGCRIFVGGHRVSAEMFPELEQIDTHGFLIATKVSEKGTDLHIMSPSGIGTLYGVWFFLMNYAGLRILMPGEIGEVYPKLERLEIPKDLYVLNRGPDYQLRIWSGNAGLDRTAWLADIGGTQRFQYHHNMFRIYDPERFAESHPEYYPIVEGSPKIPKPKQHGAWQPTFSEPAVAQRAIEYADELFSERPEMVSMSRSVNDGLGYSEADMRKAKLLPDGRASISHLYYEYVNTVARGVRKRWPDKTIAFFPYNMVKEPPDFGLEDNVMIFLLNEPKTTYEAWKDKVKSIGIYQWLYGMGWVIPNHWPHAMQDYLRWAREHGGKAFKGEAYVAWAQAGPKMWVLNNLLWNVDANVDALLMDYYEHAYGKDAAPAMANYFARAEEIYERRRGGGEYRIARWHPGEYQFERAKSEDFEFMAGALEKANQAAEEDDDRTRLDMTTRCFRWGLSYWNQYHAVRKLQAAEVSSKTDVASIIGTARAFYTFPRAREAYYKEKIEPLAQYCVYSQSRDEVDWRRVDPMFKWEGLDAAMDSAFGAISDYMQKTLHNNGVAAFWTGVGSQHGVLRPFAETQRLRLLHPDAPLANALANGSFEEPPDASEPDDKSPRISGDWKVYHNRMVNATVSLDREVFHHGVMSLTARGLTDYSGVIRRVTVPNLTRYRLSFWYRTSPQTRHAFYGILIKPGIRVHIPPVPEWTKVERVFTVNAPGGEMIDFTILLSLRHGGSEKSQVWFDDVRLEMLAPEGVEH